MRAIMILSAVLSVGASPALGGPSQPTVVELFQSQGCSSCPPANAVLNTLADRSDVLALSFAVTYWDHLGWKDRFAQPAFTQRQWDYAKRGGRGNVATPQMIVNGTGILTGNRREEVDTAIRRFARSASGPVISIEGNAGLIGAGQTDRPLTVWLVRYDPRTIDVPIRAGENAGRTLPHRNIVRSLRSLGTWRGTPLHVALPAAEAHLASALLLQQGSGGPIVVARKI